MLSYDGFFGAGTRFQTQVAGSQLDIMRATRDDLIKLEQSLGTAYTKEDKEKGVERIKARYDPEIKVLEDRVQALPNRHEDRVVDLTLWGPAVPDSCVRPPTSRDARPGSRLLEQLVRRHVAPVRSRP